MIFSFCWVFIRNLQKLFFFVCAKFSFLKEINHFWSHFFKMLNESKAKKNYIQPVLFLCLQKWNKSREVMKVARKKILTAQETKSFKSITFNFARETFKFGNVFFFEEINKVITSIIVFGVFRRKKNSFRMTNTIMINIIHHFNTQI